MESTIATILLLVGIYFLIGALFSVFFLWKGLKKVDPGTDGSGLFFKLLLFPGMTVFWVVFFKKWLNS